MQAPCQKQNLMTKESSLVMAKNLVRIALSNICYFRHLFPESYFVDRNIPELGISVKKLQYSKSKESDKIILWVDEGVTDALTKSYLKSMSFMLCAGTEDKVLEEYKFIFQYGPGGEVKGLSMQNTEIPINLSQVGVIRRKVSKLVRLLIALTTTLDELPDSRRVFLRLNYYDSTPDGYEPPHFEPTARTKFMPFATTGEKALVINLGSVETEFHRVSLHVRSALNNQLNEVSDGELENPDMEEERSEVDTLEAGLEEEDEEDERQANSPTGQDQQIKQVDVKDYPDSDPGSKDAGARDGRKKHRQSLVETKCSPQDQKIEKQVYEWCSSRGQFDRYELWRAFPHIPNSKLNSIVRSMTAQKHKWQAFGNENVFAKGQKDRLHGQGDSPEDIKCQGNQEHDDTEVADIVTAQNGKREGVGRRQRLQGTASGIREDAFHKYIKLFKSNKEFQASELEEALGLTTEEAEDLVRRLVEENVVSSPIHLRRRTIYTVKNPPNRPEDVSYSLAEMMQKVSIDTIPERRIPRKPFKKQIEFEHDPAYNHLVGRRVDIYWSFDNKWYNAIVVKAAEGKCTVKYDDGEEENLELKNEHLRWLPDNPDTEDVFSSQKTTQVKSRKISLCQSPIYQHCYKKVKRDA
mmetsp:Transcript_9187/g.55786  ORF Transcript_9187/g.55786 Transcript_9187/m.55786 type:complete len:636 (-) Transcript_9187:1830-3737(-)